MQYIVRLKDTHVILATFAFSWDAEQFISDKNNELLEIVKQ